MRLPTTTFNLIVIASFVALGAVGWMHTRLATATDASVARSARYDVTWTGSAGRMEMLELRKLMSDFLASGSPEDAAQVNLYAQIVEGRLANWDSGLFREYIDYAPERRIEFDQARAEFGDAVTEFANLQDPAVQAKILKKLDLVAPVMD
ncbi:MAG: hypothetical protein Q8O63_04435, partial [Hoeflea sp.]|nr:hypothetical protein [Hoeflea sp.]